MTRNPSPQWERQGRQRVRQNERPMGRRINHTPPPPPTNNNNDLYDWWYTFRGYNAECHFSGCGQNDHNQHVVDRVTKKSVARFMDKAEFLRRRGGVYIRED